MTDKKPTKTRRPVALPRLHKAITEFCDDKGVLDEDSIAELLDSIRDVWFDETQRK